MTALTQQNGHGDAMLAKRIADGFSGVAGLYLPATQHAVSVDTHNLLHALSYVDNAVVYGRNSDTEMNTLFDACREMDVAIGLRVAIREWERDP